MKPQLYSILYADGGIRYGVWTRAEVVEKALRLYDREFREAQRTILGFVCLGDPPDIDIPKGGKQ
jgi:hypothetical protein